MATTGSTGGSQSNTSQGPVVVKNGWAYIVRPPMWPIGTTPRVRGGVPLTGMVNSVHAVFYAMKNVERVFFLGGRDASDNVVDCPFDVELISPTTSRPAPLKLGVGWFAECLVSPFSVTPPGLVVKRYDTLAADDPISEFLKSIQPGQTSGGGTGA